MAWLTCYKNSNKKYNSNSVIEFEKYDYPLCEEEWATLVVSPFEYYYERDTLWDEYLRQRKTLYKLKLIDGKECFTTDRPDQSESVSVFDTGPM